MRIMMTCVAILTMTLLWPASNAAKTHSTTASATVIPADTLAVSPHGAGLSAVSFTFEADSTAAPADSLAGPENILESLALDDQFDIIQPPALKKRLQDGRIQSQAHQDKRTEEKKHESAIKPRTSSGFRVEVFSDNNLRTAKSGASQRRAAVMSRVPQYRVYMTFDSPFWRVRVGDFSNRGAADAAAAEIRRAIPQNAHDVRVVRCTINNR